MSKHDPASLMDRSIPMGWTQPTRHPSSYPANYPPPAPLFDFATPPEGSDLEARLAQALTHRQYTADPHPRPCNQSLEFLGDRFVNAVIATLIYKMHPHLDPYGLTNLSNKVKSNCVLSYLGLLYDLPARMHIPPTHEHIRGQQKDSADCFEAYVAVVTESIGYVAMARWLNEVLEPWVEAWYPDTKLALETKRIRKAKLASTPIKPDGGMSAQEKYDSCPRCRLRDNLERMKSNKYRPY